MKENKTPIIATFVLLAGFAIGFYLNEDSNRVRLKESEKRRHELIQLLDEQREINIINNITIEELQESLDIYFKGIGKRIDFNREVYR